MKFKLAVIGLTLVSSFALQGCYTQLAMFYPEPEVEREEDGQFYETYSRAPRRPNLYIYAQDSSNRTGLAYGVMQSRFDPFYGYNNYNNPYGYFNGVGNDYGYGYNPYGYNYNLGGYTLFIPVADSKKLRTFNKERSRQNHTNLKTNRTRTSSSSTLQSSNSSGNSSSGSRSSGSSSSGSSSSSGGRRATRRN
jgi:uncharacterized membrane protein YgcG